jgi:hypothetical protein
LIAPESLHPIVYWWSPNCVSSVTAKYSALPAAIQSLEDNFTPPYNPFFPSISGRQPKVPPAANAELRAISRHRVLYDAHVAKISLMKSTCLAQSVSP